MSTEPELIPQIEDAAVRDELATFQEVFGGTPTPVPAGTKFRPTGERRWIKETADRAILENCKERAVKYAGMNLAQREAIARQQGEKAEGASIPRRLPKKKRTNQRRAL